MQPWMSDTEESPFLDPALRKRAVKVKHVKRREKKSEKKVIERVKCMWGGGGKGQGREGEAEWGKSQKGSEWRERRAEVDFIPP